MVSGAQGQHHCAHSCYADAELRSALAGPRGADCRVGWSWSCFSAHTADCPYHRAISFHGTGDGRVRHCRWPRQWLSVVVRCLHSASDAGVSEPVRLLDKQQRYLCLLRPLSLRRLKSACRALPLLRTWPQRRQPCSVRWHFLMACALVGSLDLERLAYLHAWPLGVTPLIILVIATISLARVSLFS